MLRTILFLTVLIAPEITQASICTSTTGANICNDLLISQEYLMELIDLAAWIAIGFIVFEFILFAGFKVYDSLNQQYEPECSNYQSESFHFSKDDFSELGDQEEFEELEGSHSEFEGTHGEFDRIQVLSFTESGELVDVNGQVVSEDAQLGANIDVYSAKGELSFSVRDGQAVDVDSGEVVEYLSKEEKIEEKEEEAEGWSYVVQETVSYQETEDEYQDRMQQAMIDYKNNR